MNIAMALLLGLLVQCMADILQALLQVVVVHMEAVEVVALLGQMAHKVVLVEGRLLKFPTHNHIPLLAHAEYHLVGES